MENLKRRQRLSPFPGGSHKYIDSLKKCLVFVKAKNPPREELIEWFSRTFPPRSESKRMPTDYVYTVLNLGVVIEIDDKLHLSDIGEKFSETSENKLIYQQLDANYLAISDIVQLLREKPQTLDDVLGFLREKVKIKWKTRTQVAIRLNWLWSMGYIVQDGMLYGLSKEGRSLVEGTSEKEEKLSKHSKIRNMIHEIGRAKHKTSEREYRVNGFKVDVVWKKRPDGDPAVAWEVVLGGNLLRNAFTNLKQANELWNSDLRLVTTQNLLLKARNVLETAFSEIKSRVMILNLKAIIEWYETSVKDAKITEEMGFQSSLVMMRQARRRRRTSN
jgi:predicted RNA-binding protein